MSPVWMLWLAWAAAAPVPESYRAEAPADGGWTKERAALGKRLFFEPRLSKDGEVSCASCHDPARAFTDGKPLAVGVAGARGARNSPTLVNRALGRSQFWDGRAATLEAQALGPIDNPVEMGLPLAEAVRRLSADPSYARDFRRAFGGKVTAARLGAALAAYERTLWSVDAPFDRFLAGDAEALSPAAQRGLELFGGKARCGDCHAGVNFTDEGFHVLGVGGEGEPGRAQVTHAPADRGAFKTPTLREVARTAPYLHDGSLATLAEVIDLYDRGGVPHPNLDPKLHPLGLTAAEKADLLAFLEALSGKVIELSPDAAPAVSEELP